MNDNDQTFQLQALCSVRGLKTQSHAIPTKASKAHSTRSEVLDFRSCRFPSCLCTSLRPLQTCCSGFAGGVGADLSGRRRSCVTWGRALGVISGEWTCHHTAAYTIFMVLLIGPRLWRGFLGNRPRDRASRAGGFWGELSRTPPVRNESTRMRQRETPSGDPVAREVSAEL